ncbi:uncharacterized protein SRS1_13940 [Sporisorium reilianum f. sp. reilianum]|uniref:Uncharacterized protein n=1 Tax=Sporisorium reilianum f. sp. reilianum TaxID=72559 RepID=A0A2N8UDQ9_9BASI|nr:uncharacterized protein SRS1_13940 [Sporisorium reilianum f. sp. reilianum]
MPSPAPNRPSAAALSPFGRNSQNAALLSKANKSATPPPASPSSSSNKQAPSTPKSSKASGIGNDNNAGSSSGNRSISLSSRSSPLASNRFTSPSTPGGSGGGLSLVGASSSIYDSTGLLSRDFETTYHRQCRTLLMAFAAAARMWEEIATFDGLKWAKEAVEGWEDVGAANKLGQREAGATRQAKGPASGAAERAQDKKRALALDPKQAHDPILGPGGVRETRMAAAVGRIEAAHDGLATVVDRLNKALNKLTTASDSLTTLLEEASQRKGLEFAFQDPMWATWPLHRFIERTTDLTKQYRISTQHLTLLVPTLIQSGEPPASKAVRNDEQAAEKRSQQRRAAYEAWIGLPYLETRGAQSLVGLEAVCEVEVGRWRE